MRTPWMHTPWARGVAEWPAILLFLVRDGPDNEISACHQRLSTACILDVNAMACILEDNVMACILEKDAVVELLFELVQPLVQRPR